MTQIEPKLSITGAIWGVLAAIVLAILSYCFFDEKLLFLSQEGLLKGDPAKSLFLMELFGHGTGILVVGLLIFCLDRDQTVQFLAVTLVPAIFGALLKLFVLRVRPSQLAENLPGGISTRIAFQLTWFDSNAGEHGLVHDGVHSFPSGHAVTAFAMATALTAIYPRGRYLFFGIAILAGFQRLVAGAHYFSDVIAGAVLGYLLATIVIWIRAGKKTKAR